jgi:hypothetical protein
VRYNRLRHGLYAPDLLIPEVDGPDAKVQFEKLLGQLRKRYEPTDIVAEFDVEEMAVGYWMRRRVQRCLKGETLRKLVAGERARDERATRVRREMTLLAVADKHDLTRTRAGLEFLLTVLERIRADVERVGHLSQEARARLVAHFPAELEGLVSECLRDTVLATAAKQEPGTHPDAPSPAQSKEQILTRLDAERERLLGLQRAHEEADAREEERDRLSASLPEPDKLDRILACDTRYERQVDRARNRLERRQAES